MKKKWEVPEISKIVLNNGESRALNEEGAYRPTS